MAEPLSKIEIAAMRRTPLICETPAGTITMRRKALEEHLCADSALTVCLVQQTSLDGGSAPRLGRPACGGRKWVKRYLGTKIVARRRPQCPAAYFDGVG